MSWLTNNDNPPAATTPISEILDNRVTDHNCSPQASGTAPGDREFGKPIHIESHGLVVAGIDSRETSTRPFSSLVLSESRTFFDRSKYFFGPNAALGNNLVRSVSQRFVNFERLSRRTVRYTLSAVFDISACGRLINLAKERNVRFAEPALAQADAGFFMPG